MIVSGKLSRRPGLQALEVVEGQNLEGYDVLPGFSLPLVELFA